MDDGGSTLKPIVIPQDPYKPEGTDVKRVIQINSGIVK